MNYGVQRIGLTPLAKPGALLHELGLQQDNLGKAEVKSLWLRLWHILCVIYVLDCPTHLETTKLISIPKGTEKSYLQGLSEWLVKAFYSLYIEISICMSKPNDFLGLLYVTFDYTLDFTQSNAWENYPDKPKEIFSFFFWSSLAVFFFVLLFYTEDMDIIYISLKKSSFDSQHQQWSQPVWSVVFH